jgi:transcriptional regulator with XRE-family HTH domain
MNQTKIIITRIKKVLNLKTNIDLANVTGIPINTISRWMQRNSIPIDFVSDVVEKYNISYDSLLNEKYIESDLITDTVHRAIISCENNITALNELNKHINEFTNSNIRLTKIKNLLKAQKGETLFEKMSKLMNGESERLFLLFYYFLIHLEKEQFNMNDDFKHKFINNFNNLEIKKDFLELVKEFNIPSFQETKYVVEICLNDKSRLINLITELDELSVIELIKRNTEIRQFIKDEMLSTIDRVVINLLKQ